jgi:hypothetical protein
VPRHAIEPRDTAPEARPLEEVGREVVGHAINLLQPRAV